MVKQLDFEEQEQLEQVKHFWRQYGTLITGLIVAAALAVTGWNGWQYWQTRQAQQAAVLYNELATAAQAEDMAKLERIYADMRKRFSGTTYTQQAALLAAKSFNDKGQAQAAQQALTWLIDNTRHDGYKAVARLRLAGLLMQTQAYPAALAQLQNEFPSEFNGLVADRKADIFKAQGKKDEARAEYQKAYQALDDQVPYRRLVGIKLNAMGVDPTKL